MYALRARVLCVVFLIAFLSDDEVLRRKTFIISF